MDDLKALSYYASLTHISRKVANQEKSLIKYLGNKWLEYSQDQKEELLNDLCVPHFIREEHQTLALAADDEDGDTESTDSSSLPVCWPTLKLPSGEKIIVDETDIWTWQDEHSGPFSWKSKSQQDLTLLDFDADNLTKPIGKRNNKLSSSETQAPSAHRAWCHFAPNRDSWTGTVLADYFTNGQDEAATPVHTPFTSLSPTEEVNQGFEGSAVDLSPMVTPAHATSPIALQDSDQNDNAALRKRTADPVILEIHDTTQSYATKAKSKGHVKTPSPKKQANPNLTRRDAKATDSSRNHLILANRDDEKNAFTNPAMEVEWSSFVGQSSVDPSKGIAGSTGSVQANNGGDATPPLKRDKDGSVAMTTLPSHRSEPRVMVMDRGSESIVPDVGKVSGGEESAESTPDHTTQLLKNAGVGAPGRTAMAQVEEAKEEVVYVVDDGDGSVTVTSQLLASDAGKERNRPLTGFDFLDNW